MKALLVQCILSFIVETLYFELIASTLFLLGLTAVRRVDYQAERIPTPCGEDIRYHGAGGGASIVHELSNLLN